MSFPHRKAMNRYWAPQTNPTETGTRNHPRHKQQAVSSPARALSLPPTHLNRPPRRPGNGREPPSESTGQRFVQRLKAKTPSDEGICVPKVGLELHSSPWKHGTPAETCGFQPDPPHIRSSPRRKAWTVHTPNSRIRALRTPAAPAQERGSSLPWKSTWVGPLPGLTDASCSS
jgi:hypothetical protein